MANLITAINKAHQSVVSRCYKHYRAYHALVNLDGTFDTDKAQAANERKQETKYDQYIELFEELPVREQKNFNNQHKTLHGY